MKRWFLGLFAIALAAAPLGAQPITRLKARLVAFDGKVMTLDTGAKDKLAVSVMPETRFVQSAPASLGDVKPGDWAGAAFTEDRKGQLIAHNVYLYAATLRGTGEGRFPDNDRLMVNGEVTKTEPGAKNDLTLTLHYRGALLSPTGKGRSLCEGRASPAAYASPLACAADAAIQVASGTPILAMTMGTASLLAPGVNVTVSMTRLSDGGAIAPGVVVEKPLAPPAPVAKSRPTP